MTVLRLLGRDPASFGRNQDINLAEIAIVGTAGDHAH